MRIESRLYNRDSFLTIETRFSHSRLDSHNRDSILTIETRFSQSRLDSQIRDSILTIESHFSQSSLFSHNRVSFHTIESRFTQSSASRRKGLGSNSKGEDLQMETGTERASERTEATERDEGKGLATFFCKPGFLTIENIKLIFLCKFVAFHPK